VHICSVVTPTAASDNELRLFHSAEYLECLRRLSQLDDSEKSIDDLEEFGLGKSHKYSCTVLKCIMIISRLRCL